MIEFSTKIKMTADMQSKAIKDVRVFTEAMEGGNSRKLYKVAQKSWKQNHNRDRINILYKGSIRVKLINFVTDVMIDVFIHFGESEDLYRVRFVAESSNYITDPESPFRWNPNSLRKV